MSKYTKGPWKYSIRKIESCSKCTPNPGSIGDVRSEMQDICTIYTDKNQQANARLISAAPELLEALKNLVSRATASEENTTIFKQANQAIAKAEDIGR